MNKNIVFDKEVTIESIIDLMEYMDGCLVGTDTGMPIEKVTLNFSSPGGSYDAITMFTNYVNNYPLDLEIICYGENYSAGLIFLLEVNRPLTILDSAKGMFHISDILLSGKDMRDMRSFSSFMKDEGVVIDNKLMDQYAKCGLTESELDYIRDGGDLYVNAERLRACIEAYDNYEATIILTEEIAVLEKEIKDRKGILMELNPNMEFESEEVLIEKEYTEHEIKEYIESMEPATIPEKEVQEKALDSIFKWDGNGTTGLGTFEGKNEAPVEATNKSGICIPVGVTHEEF